MSHADKRSPVTDALETLGMIHFKPEARDAIHLAVEPVIADSILAPGQKIGIIDGYAIPTGALYNTGVLDAEGKVILAEAPYHGIVDPFLPGAVQVGERFWFVMAPRMVHSLRHVWEHPDFKKGS